MAAGPKQRKRLAIQKALDRGNTRHYLDKYGPKQTDATSGTLHSSWDRWPVNKVTPNGWLTKPHQGFALRQGKLSYVPKSKPVKGRWKA